MSDAVADQWLPASLFGLMFAMGLALTPQHFVNVIRNATALVTGVVSIVVALPALGFLLAYLFDLPPELALGLVLVAACPGGTFSNLLTSYAGGDLALSISLTTIVSLFAVITLPLAAGLALAAFGQDAAAVELPVTETLLKVFLLTVLPVLLGMLARTRAGVAADRWSNVLKNVAAVCIVAFFLMILGDNLALMREAVREAWLPVLTLNVLSLSAGLAISLACRLEHRRLVAVAIEHSIKQEGTGIVIAVGILSLPVAALPLLLNSVLGLVIGTAFTVAVRRGT